MAERASIGDALAIDVPEGADPAVAAGLGIAGLAGWLPFAWRAPLEGGENVLVLGATGSVGLVAVQTAKLLARRASSPPAEARRGSRMRWRSARTRRSGWTRRTTSRPPSRMRSAARARATSSTRSGGRRCGRGPGRGPRATIVNLGQSAGATSELASAAVRFKSLSILGHTNFAVPPDELADHYRRLVGHVTAGDIVFEVDRVPLDDAAAAWQRQADGPGAKLVVVP